MMRSMTLSETRRVYEELERAQTRIAWFESQGGGNTSYNPQNQQYHQSMDSQGQTFVPETQEGPYVPTFNTNAGPSQTGPSNVGTSAPPHDDGAFQSFTSFFQNDFNYDDFADLDS